MTPSQNAIDIFPWDDNFNTGLPRIDEQHRRLVELLNRLASNVAFGTGDTELNRIFDDLVDYTVYHFQTEEAIWGEHLAGDGDEIAHRSAHASFVDRVTALKAEQSSRPLARIAEDALDFLVRWLASHILESDRRMAHVVLALQSGLTLEAAKRQAAELMSGSTRNMIDIILSIYSTLSRNTLQLMREVTEHRQAELELRRQRENLQLILDHAPIGIWLQDGKGHMSVVNKAFCDAVGIPEAEFLAVPHYGELIPAQFRPQCLASDDKALAGAGPTETLQQLPFVDGKVHDLRVLKAVKRDAEGRPEALVGLSMDVTEELRQRRALEEATRAAEAANLAKSQFLATMSHEIRTPLNGVLGMAQLLLMPDLDRAEQQEFARTILNSGNTLLALLNDILDLSKVEAGKLELTSAAFDPAQLLDEVATLMVENAATKGLAFAAHWKGPPDIHLRGDPIRIRQMLGNLVSNAIKFTDSGQVLVDAEMDDTPTADNTVRVRFTVTDTGIGIPPDKLRNLFQPFSQVDASDTRRFGGTGLGLSIVRSLAERMGGKAGVSSEPGKGSRFWFEVPLEQATGGELRTGTRHMPPPEQAGTTAGRILLVEDNGVNRLVVERLLLKFGFEVLVAEDGGQALERFKADHGAIDLVLMDLQMPVMDGLEATRRIRAHEAAETGGHVPIVALTANAFDKDREACAAAGMDDFLAKPVNAGQLLRTLEQHLADRT